MGEIAQLLQEKVGLSPDQAQSAENAVLEYVRGKVPPEFQGMVGSVLGGGQTASGDQPAAAGGLGGLLGAAEGFLK
ncbi:MAG TPA: hypothetical protein VK716_01005 [Terracidiphilus sp.]|nr:hypothetical protein [Terracidiphilus sp.]